LEKSVDERMDFLPDKNVNEVKHIKFAVCYVLAIHEKHIMLLNTLEQIIFGQ
jgi:hypothetical protein